LLDPNMFADLCMLILRSIVYFNPVFFPLRKIRAPPPAVASAHNRNGFLVPPAGLTGESYTSDIAVADLWLWTGPVRVPHPTQFRSIANLATPDHTPQGGICGLQVCVYFQRSYSTCSVFEVSPSGFVCVNYFIPALYPTDVWASSPFYVSVQLFPCFCLG